MREPPSSFERNLDAVIAAAELSIKHAESVASSAADHNSFAVALYAQLHPRGGNQFFSPFSIRTALVMTYVGARGKTAAEMRRVLRISAPDESLHAAFADMIQSLNATRGAGFEMAVANSLWGQVGAPLEPAFRELIANQYGGSVNLVDFRDEVSRAIINRWVEDHTARKIVEFLPPGSPHTDTRLVLVNAVYLKALWAFRFDKELTRDEPFFLEGGGEVRTPLMHQTERVRYLKGPDYQAVGLDYRGSNLSMLVLLPDRRDGLRDLEVALTAPIIEACVKSPRMREVEVFLPRFTISWGTINLHESLEALGMRLAFDPLRADLSGINGRKPPDAESLYVSAVLHKAFADVNEEGTEAAAATGVAVLATGISRAPPPPTPVFRADHPFLFAICDRKTHTIVFLGRVVDPTGQS